MWFIIFYVLGKSDSGLRCLVIVISFHQQEYLPTFNGRRVPSNVDEHRKPREVVMPAR